MATADVSNTSPNSLPKVASTARALFGGWLWGALMLAVFGLWMRSKYEGRAPVVTPIFFVAGLIAAALACWQAFTLWFAKELPEQRRRTLLSQQRLFGLVFLIGGLGLIVMAFCVGLGKKESGGTGFLLDNFAETVGCLLLGLIALACGFVLQMPAEESESPMQFLVAKVPVLKLSQVVIGACCLVAFVYLGFVKRIGVDWFPELAALVFMSMLCMSCFFLLNTSSLDEFGVRLFVLLFGGITGLILFFLSLGRAYLWRQDIFLGGIVAWQGAEAWHFWLCAYLFFSSLVLMAVSFNLGRADIRSNVALRRVMYGYDAIVQALLVVGILAVMNVVVYAMVPYTYDWTQGRGIYDLSPSTKNLIGGLKKEVNMIVLLPQGTLVYRDVKILTDNMQALSNNLRIKYVSPDADFVEYGILAKTFPQIMPDPRFGGGGGGRGVLIVNGPVPTGEVKDAANLSYAFVPERKLSEFDRQQAMQGGRNKYFFKGEAEIMKELKFLLQDKTKRKVYVLQGDDEPNFADDRNGQDRGFDFRTGFKSVGIGIFSDNLKKDNYEVFGLTFQPEIPAAKTANTNLVHAQPEEGGKQKEIPKDCKTLIVAGVSKALASETVEAIERYVERGGKIIVFLDVIANADFSKLMDFGLEPMLKRYGVEVTDAFPLTKFTRDPRIRPIEDIRRVDADTPFNSSNPLPKQFSDKVFLLPLSARILKLAEAPGAYKAESIMEMYPADSDKPHGRWGFKFTDVSALKNPFNSVVDVMNDRRQFEQHLILKSPAVVGAAVSKGDTPFMLVFGDTDFITNVELASPQNAANYTLVANGLEWLVEREVFFGAQPRETNTYQMKINTRTPEGSDEALRMILLPGWIMLLSMIGLGVGIWITRRR